MVSALSKCGSLRANGEKETALNIATGGFIDKYTFTFDLLPETGDPTMDSE